MQPHPLTSVMQMAITAAALVVAAAAVYFAVVTARGERNAALVRVGIAVLRADPTKEAHVKAAREWALDLIDANAGGVKFSKAAREELMQKGFDLGSYVDSVDYTFTPDRPREPPPPHHK